MALPRFPACKLPDRSGQAGRHRRLGIDPRAHGAMGLRRRWPWPSCQESSSSSRRERHWARAVQPYDRGPQRDPPLQGLALRPAHRAACPDYWGTQGRPTPGCIRPHRRRRTGGRHAAGRQAPCFQYDNRAEPGSASRSRQGGCSWPEQLFPAVNSCQRVTVHYPVLRQHPGAVCAFRDDRTRARSVRLARAGVEGLPANDCHVVHAAKEPVPELVPALCRRSQAQVAGPDIVRAGHDHHVRHGGIAGACRAQLDIWRDRRPYWPLYQRGGHACARPRCIHQRVPTRCPASAQPLLPHKHRRRAAAKA
eukprot:m.68237 g.68237  ORF g.68237 m.68237 type:complete len:308 (+) comp7490_c0_seq2:64-987(+)